MAARLSGNRIAWKYTANNGTVYRVAAQKAVTDQLTGGSAVKVGGSTGVNWNPPKPGSLKMRRITMIASGYGSRVIPVYAIDAPVLTAGETLTLNVPGGTDAQTYSSSGALIPEGWSRAPSVTNQGS